MIRRAFSTLFAAAVVAGAMGVATPEIQASDCHQPQCVWKTVTVYESVTKPFVSYVTKYDHCGKPFQVKVVSYKTIQVPVQKLIKVCY